jgi:hypothetical protein
MSKVINNINHFLAYLAYESIIKIVASNINKLNPHVPHFYSLALVKFQVQCASSTYVEMFKTCTSSTQTLNFLNKESKF